MKGQKIYENYGYHLMGYLVPSQRDKAGQSNSVFFAATAEGNRVKEQFASKVDAQLYDLEALFRVKELDACGVD